MASRRNNALTYYVNGRRARDLNGLTDMAGRVLSAYDTATKRAVVGLKRRALPIVRRAVRQHYNVKAGALSDKYRVETGLRGRSGDRDDFLSVWASTRSIPLLDFGGRWGGRKTKGAVASIQRGQRKTYDGAFIATVRGRRAIRVRQYDTARGKRHGRGPLRMLYGPSPFEMLSGLDHRGSQQAQRKVLAEMTDYYAAELRRQFKLSQG